MNLARVNIHYCVAWAPAIGLYNSHHLNDLNSNSVLDRLVTENVCYAVSNNIGLPSRYEYWEEYDER